MRWTATGASLVVSARRRRTRATIAGCVSVLRKWNAEPQRSADGAADECP
jgi:hypothetical protein